MTSSLFRQFRDRCHAQYEVCLFGVHHLADLAGCPARSSTYAVHSMRPALTGASKSTVRITVHRADLALDGWNRHRSSEMTPSSRNWAASCSARRRSCSARSRSCSAIPRSSAYERSGIESGPFAIASSLAHQLNELIKLCRVHGTHRLEHDRNSQISEKTPKGEKEGD